MCHKRQSFYQRLYLFPDFGKDGCFIRIVATQTMYLTAPEIIIVWLRLDKRVERIYNFSIAYDDYSNGANRRTLVVSCLKIYCCKIQHGVFSFSSITQTYLLTTPCPLSLFIIGVDFTAKIPKKNAILWQRLKKIVEFHKTLSIVSH